MHSKIVNNRATIALSLWAVVCLGLLYPSLAMSQDQADWSEYLSAFGVNDVLDQADALIDQEIRNLENAPLGFTSDELQRLSSAFSQQLGSDTLRKKVISKLQLQFDADTQRQLRSVLRSPAMKELLELQASMDDAQVRKAMRLYRMKLKELTPSEARIQLLQSLDALLQQSLLESELKVELRKQLLAAVSHLKTKESFSETLLEQQLQDYRLDVEEEISENALYAYLYLLKRTPSSKVRDLLVSLDQPAYDQFMAICLKAIQETFVQARQQLDESVRLAGRP